MPSIYYRSYLVFIRNIFKELTYKTREIIFRIMICILTFSYINHLNVTFYCKINLPHYMYNTYNDRSILGSIVFIYNMTLYIEFIS